MLGRRQLTDLYGKLFPHGAQPNMMASFNTPAMQMDAETGVPPPSELNG